MATTLDFAPIFALCLAGRAPPAGWSDAAGWVLAPATLLPVLLIGALGLRRVLTAGDGRGWRGAAFGFGYAALVLAVVTPLCRYAAAMASANMIQHMLLIVVAPALMVLALEGAGRARLPALRPRHAAILYGLAVWLWHAPALYDASLTDPTLHLVKLASLLAIAWLFWSSIVRAARSGGRALEAGVVVLASMIQTGALGALIAFAPRLLYGTVATATTAMGLDPAADQQTAGLIMWIPGGALFMVAGLALVMVALRGQENPRGDDILDGTRRKSVHDRG